MKQRSHERLKWLLDKQIQHVCTSDEEKELAFLISLSDDKQLQEALFSNWEKYENYESTEILSDEESTEILSGILSRPDKIVEKQKSRKRLFFRYSAAASIAILIAAGIFFNRNKPQNPQTGNIETRILSSGELVDSTLNISRPDEPAAAILHNENGLDKQLPATKTNRIASAKPRSGNHAEKVQDFKISEVQKPVSGQEIEPSQVIIKPIAESKSGSKSEPKQSAIAEKTNTDSQITENVIVPEIEDNDNVVPVKKQKNKLSLLTSFGSGSMANNDMMLSSQSMFQGEASLLTRSNMYAVESKTQELIETQYFPDVTHLPSLSVGMMFNKSLNNTYSLEWGLVYTSLRSIFENKEQSQKARLHLHYIGVPLNLQARISGNKSTKWGIYFSAGAMIEKGIYSHFRQDGQNGSYRLQITSNEKISGFRYSLSFAPGVDYKLSPKYSIFLEPKFSYYFKNKQLVSVRAEHPVVFGVNAGLKFGW
jgi:hypothetical protein